MVFNSWSLVIRLFVADLVESSVSKDLFDFLNEAITLENDLVDGGRHVYQMERTGQFISITNLNSKLLVSGRTIGCHDFSLSLLILIENKPLCEFQ